jgi:signal transduction histidine kinase/DNA-binding NarL/FixJ family response regulator
VTVRSALATIPVLAVLWAGIGTYLIQKHNAGLERATLASSNLAHAFEENIRRSVESIDTTIRALRVARAQDPDRFAVAAWEHGSGLTRDLTLQLSLANRTGLIVDSNLGSANGASIADRPHFQAVRDAPGDTLFISRPVLGRVSGRWSVQFVRKLPAANGDFGGVIVASLDPAFLSRFSQSLDIGDGALLLLGPDGIVRSGAPAAAAALNADVSGTPLMDATHAAASGTIEMAGPSDATRRIYSWRLVAPYGLIVAVGLSRGAALADFRHDRTIAIAAGTGITILTIVAAILLSRHRRDLMLSREVLRAAVDNIAQGLLVVTPDRRVPVLNARASVLLGLPPALSHPGIEIDSLLEWQLEQGEFQEAPDVQTLAESGGFASGETVYNRTRANGTVLEVRTKTLGNGMAVRTFTDITEQPHQAQVLAAARDAAEAATRTRTEFLAVMSHEIRTPLNGVIGVAGLLEEMELGPAQRDYVRLIRQSGDHLLELINDILDFSRLEAGRVELEAVDFDPAALTEGIATMFQAQAAAKGLELTVHADAPPVTGDPARLRQILLNLVGNAVKFTAEGSVWIGLAAEQADGGMVRLTFRVADSGIGMDQAAIDKAFQAFTQMDGSISRRYGGSGLGLAICRQLLALMGGTIQVDSEPGVGSTFSFGVTLKAAAAPAETVAEAAGPDQRPLRVLLAEDNPTNRLVATHLLERMGHRAEAVENGAEAVAAAACGQYDLILMDVMMPEMDGLTATRIIRERETSGRRMAIVGLTAGSAQESLAACIEAGMDTVTTKPVTPGRLRAAIAEGLNAAGRPPQPDPPSSRLHELAEALGEEVAAEIVQTFADDSQGHLNTMRAAAAAGDSRTIFRSAHSLAGAARTVGADSLAERAALLEKTVGEMAPARILAEIGAMQADLDTLLAGWHVSAGNAMTS